MHSLRPFGAWFILFAVISVAGCKRADWTPISDASHGRYLGVGIYGPGKQWTRLVANQTAKSDAVARPIDDQVLIVVADSQTGELRACGDLTGYCIGMNPWKQSLLGSQMTPINLTSHVQPEDPNMTVDVERAPRKPKPQPYKPASSLRAPPAGDPARSRTGRGRRSWRRPPARRARC
jgi:hypothetical protein